MIITITLNPCIDKSSVVPVMKPESKLRCTDVVHEAGGGGINVSKALKKLDPKFRVIVVMRMLQGYSTKETAEILDIPIGTVLSRLSRAQEQMRIILEKM